LARRNSSIAEARLDWARSQRPARAPLSGAASGSCGGARNATPKAVTAFEGRVTINQTTAATLASGRRSTDRDSRSQAQLQRTFV
jgi:hypothetical protein